VATRMQQRRGTSTQWQTANPILNEAEIGFEIDTNQFKIGDGTNHWNDLSYFVDETALSTSLGDYVETDLLGVANGVATLNSSGVLESSQLPDISDIPTRLIVTQIDTFGNIVETYSDISTLAFDEDSGFDVTDLGNGIAKVAMNSTFKFWEIDGDPGLEAEGLDTVNLISGNGINLLANNESTPKTLTISSSGGDGAGLQSIAYYNATDLATLNTSLLEIPVGDLLKTDLIIKWIGLSSSLYTNPSEYFNNWYYYVMEVSTKDSNDDVQLLVWQIDYDNYRFSNLNASSVPVVVAGNYSDPEVVEFWPDYAGPLRGSGELIISNAGLNNKNKKINFSLSIPAEQIEELKPTVLMKSTNKIETLVLNLSEGNFSLSEDGYLEILTI